MDPRKFLVDKVLMALEILLLELSENRGVSRVLRILKGVSDDKVPDTTGSCRISD